MTSRATCGFCDVVQHVARLHGVGHQPVVDDVHRRHMRGIGDSRVGRGGVADGPVIDQVVVGLGMELRRARFERADRIGHCRPLLVADRHLLGSVARLALGVGNDDRDGIADEAHAIDRERRPGAHLHRGAVLGLDHPAADQVADAVGLQLLAGEHADHARHRLRGLDVDAFDVGMRVRAPHERRVLHARHDHVVDIAAEAGDESLVFLARNPCADAFHAHQNVSSQSSERIANGE
jgi:hypothetical protein